MEPNRVYESIIYALNNTLKDEMLRTKLLLKKEFTDSFITLVNDLLVLEKDHNCKFEEKEWSAIFAKAIVNVTKEKNKFVKPDNKDVEAIYGDYAFLLTYILNTFKISRDVITSTNIKINEEEVKLNQKVTDSMKDMYAEKPEEKPEPEVVDKEKEKPNTGTGPTNNFGGQQGGFGGQQGGYGQNEIPLHPMQDDRFYPFKTKIKKMRIINIINATLMLTVTLMAAIMFFFQVFVTTEMGKGTSSPALNGGGDNEPWAIQNDDKSDTFSATKVGIDFFSGRTSGILKFFPILFLLAIGIYNGFLMFKPANRYRDKFRIQGITLFIMLIFGFMAFSQYQSLYNIVFNTKNVTNALGEAYWKELFKDLPNSNKEDFLETWNNLMNWMLVQLKLDTFKIIFGIGMAVNCLFVIGLVATWIINPRIDREKVMKANYEYQQVIAAAMQGQKYEMDESLFVPRAEYDAFLEEVKKRQEAKQAKSKKDD